MSSSESSDNEPQTIASTLESLNSAIDTTVKEYLASLEHPTYVVTAKEMLARHRGLFPQFDNPIPARQVLTLLWTSGFSPDKLYAAADRRVRCWILAFAAAMALHIQYDTVVHFIINQLAAEFDETLAELPEKPDFSAALNLSGFALAARHTSFDGLFREMTVQALKQLGISTSRALLAMVSHALTCWTHYARSSTIAWMNESRATYITQLTLEHVDHNGDQDRVSPDDLMNHLEADGGHLIKIPRMPRGLRRDMSQKRDASPVRGQES